MKFILHKSNTRGHANQGWLNSFHTFSFANYFDASRIHFGLLRVLNDDTIEAGTGFGTHPHDNMEIVTIPLLGKLHHIDSTGRDRIIKQNDVQIMNAGSGILHSEINSNHDNQVKLLQIWVLPKNINISPNYQQKTFLPQDRINKIVTVVAPNDENALWINQDAWFSLTNLSKDFTIQYSVHQPNNGVYVFVIKGEAMINNIQLNERDGIGISETNRVHILANSDAELLLIDIPMQ